MDGLEKLHGVGSLVGLQPADPMEPHVSVAGEQRRPFPKRLLHPILAEIPLARVDQGLNLVGRASLADDNELDFRGITPGKRGGTRDVV